MALKLNEISPFKLIYYAFRIAGLMNKNGRPWSLILTVYHVTMINLFGLTAIFAVYHARGNLRETILSISSLVIYAQLMPKVVVILSNEVEIINLLNRFEEYRLEVLEDKDRKNFVIESDRIGTNFLTFYSSFFMSYPFITFLINFNFDYFTDFKNPHLSAKLYVPWKMNTMGPYIAGNIYTSLAALSTLGCYVSFQILQFLITFQMSAYLKVLQHRIETYGPTDKVAYQHHKIIIMLLRDFNLLFSGCLYEEVLISSLQPCGFGYTFIKSLKSHEPGLFNITYSLFMTLLGSFIMCACGEEISSQVEKLHDSSYMSNWYEENPRTRRNLFMMKLVASKSYTVNYRIFVVFNFPCFTTIIQGIYSFLTMIINFE